MEWAVNPGNGLPSCLEAEPEVDNLLVSDVTSESFRLSWMADEDLFDSFVIKVRDSKKLSDPLELTVPGQEHTIEVPGLLGGTEYEIELYGVARGQRWQPINAVARTGISLNNTFFFFFSKLVT